MQASRLLRPPASPLHYQKTSQIGTFTRATQKGRDPTQRQRCHGTPRLLLGRRLRGLGLGFEARFASCVRATIKQNHLSAIHCRLLLLKLEATQQRLWILGVWGRLGIRTNRHEGLVRQAPRDGACRSLGLGGRGSSGWLSWTGGTQPHHKHNHRSTCDKTQRGACPPPPPPARPGHKTPYPPLSDVLPPFLPPPTPHTPSQSCPPRSPQG